MNKNDTTNAGLWNLLALLIAPGCLAAAMSLFVTSRFGPGLAPDSAVYVQSTRNLSAGRGFVQAIPSRPGEFAAIAWYPPAYPALLSIGHWASIDAIPIARWISALALALSVAIGVAMTWAITRSRAAALCSALLFCFAADEIEIYSYVLSEPLFIVMTLAALACLAGFVASDKWSWLIAAGACASVAAMARYLGLMLVPLGALVIILLPRWPWRRRLLGTLCFMLISGAANFLWVIRNRRVAPVATGRSIAWHPASGGDLIQLFQTLGRWLLPGEANRLWPIVAIVIAVAIAGVVIGRRMQRHAMLDVLALFIVVYVTALFAAISLVDSAAPVDYRLLMPIFIPGIVVAVSSARFLSDNSNRAKWFPRVISIALIALLITCDLQRTPAMILQAHRVGARLGYASKRWDQSRAMRLLHRVPVDAPTWTNAPDATYLRTGRFDRVLPSKYSRDGARPIVDYPASIESVRQTILASGGAVFVFAGVLRHGMPAVDQLDRDLHDLVRIDLHNDAMIYAHPITAQRIMQSLDAPAIAKTKRHPATTRAVDDGGAKG